jgi:hypothetical protein
MFVPVVRLSHHYIQTPKNPHILDIFSRVRVSYILFGDILLIHHILLFPVLLCQSQDKTLSFMI